MTTDLVLYTNPMSRGRVARWMLEETGVEYGVEVLDYPDMKSPGYLRINPMGKVPAIRHGDVVVTEAAAICAYLADAFPEAGLAPPTDARAAYYRWLFFTAGPLESANLNKMLGFEVPTELERSAGYGTFGAVVDTLEGALSEGPYVAGTSFSAADVYVGAHIGWGMHMLKTIEPRPVFEDYWARVSARPAHVRAEAKDDALAAAAAPDA